MAVGTGEVETVLQGSSGLSTSEIQSFIDRAKRFYEGTAPTGNVTQNRKDDVVRRLAAHLIAYGPEPEVESGSKGSGNASFVKPESGTDHARIAAQFDPTGELINEFPWLDGSGGEEFTLAT